MSIFVTCLGITMALGIAAILGCSSVLMVWAGVGTGVGGIGQSFLVSNIFSYADPALGQGEPCLTWAMEMSSSGGGLTSSFRDLVVGCGTSANCSIANLYTVTGIDSALDLTIGVCVLTVATMGAGLVDVGVEGVGWVSTLTLYLLLAIMVFLLFSVKFVLGPGDFLTLGLDWSQLVWLHMGLLPLGLGLGSGLGTKSPFQFQVCSHLPDEGVVRMELCAPGIALNYLGCSVLLNVSMPCMFFTFTSTSTVSTDSQHLKYLWRKLHSGCNICAIWKISFIVISEF